MSISKCAGQLLWADILQKIAHSAGPNRTLHQRIFDETRQNNDLDVGLFDKELGGCHGTIHVGHNHIHPDDIRFQSTTQGYGLFAIVCHPYHFELIKSRKQQGQPIPYQPVIIYDQQSECVLSQLSSFHPAIVQQLLFPDQPHSVNSSPASIDSARSCMILMPRPQMRALGSEATPIVLDTKHQVSILVLVKPGSHGSRARMFVDVIERFLCNAMEGEFGFLREYWIDLKECVHMYMGSPREHIHRLLQEFVQLSRFQCIRAQLEQ